ncbi:hypothetical protein [Fontibacillus sp. BL9]|uniref:hypothetical protein n=1 Tax=Fontibacillus sp. BL9 TaxID=3389971 RepID=UPI00397B90D2
MITARGMKGETSGVITRQVAQPQPKQPAQAITVRHKVTMPVGDIHATVTLEAVDESAGVVVRLESFRATQPLMNSTIIFRKMQFCDALTADGYAVKI